MHCKSIYFKNIPKMIFSVIFDVKIKFEIIDWYEFSYTK